MHNKTELLVWLGLVFLITACSQTEPTRVFLPTSTPPPATSTVRTAPTATLSLSMTPQPSATQSPSQPPSPTGTSVPATSTSSPAPSATPTAPPLEPTQTSTPVETSEAFPPAVSLVPVLTGFENPVYLTHASEAAPWASRLLIVEKVGRILMAERGQVQPVPYLDIRDRVGSSASEQGLLSVAFPPDFAASAFFYVNYTDLRGDTVVARFRMSDGDPPWGDPDSEQKLLEIDQPAGNHNGGQIEFGPDGYLYIGMGDGGRAGDPWGNAQNPSALLGKMLRLDVSTGDAYRIPGDNPFLEWSDVRSEIWALGVRNPWRFSFDRATGDLYFADVGQNTYEEVHVQPAHSGGGENYGWNVMEGNHCFQPASGCDPTGLILPVAEYNHSLGCSITGGYVYRGMRYPSMQGTYFFGDFCSGRIWGLKQASDGEWNMALLIESDVNISSFGQDAAGEIYVLGYRDGTIYHLRALD